MATATRAAFGDALAEFGADTRVVVLDADLAKSTKSEKFAVKYPDRFFEMGIAEANMLGTGAGLALSGKVAFACSFACFVTGRFDQIRVSVAYSHANLRIVGTHAGVAIGEDGFSQMGLEDIAMLRALPNMIVLQPADAVETRAVIKYLIDDYVGPAYVRLTRQNVVDVHDASDYKFELGKGEVLREGSDVTIVASGGTVEGSLQAADALEKDGLSARVVNICSIKPIDADLLAESAERTGCVVTVEDHFINGGLGGAVCEVLGERRPTPVKRLAVERFGESGDPSELYGAFGLDPASIERAARELIANKA
jgi:transketolase